MRKDISKGLSQGGCSALPGRLNKLQHPILTMPTSPCSTPYLRAIGPKPALHKCAIVCFCVVMALLLIVAHNLSPSKS